MNDLVLQTHQFFKNRVARGEHYAKSHRNGDADDREDEEQDNEVRENPAHKNVFHRPKE